MTFIYTGAISPDGHLKPGANPVFIIDKFILGSTNYCKVKFEEKIHIVKQKDLTSEQLKIKI